MSQLLRRLTGGLSAVLILMVASLTAALPAQAQPGDGAVERFGACVAAQKSGRVLLLIDESGSLQETDPNNARVTAAKYLVDQLTRFAADSGAAMDVAVAGFSTDFTKTIDWTRLDEAGKAKVDNGIDGFASRNTGSDTDYWQALNGAQQELAAAGGGEGGPACRALAWLTDGKLDFDPRPGVDEKPYAPGQNFETQAGVDATKRAAAESICRPGGLADQLRSSGIVTFGLGLAPDVAKHSDFDLLKSIVTGETTPTGPCGELTSPTPGAFYLAQNIDDLLFAFDAVSTPGQPPIQTESGVCPGGAICEEAKHRFVLDNSVRSVNVLASADKAGLTPVLVPPIGPPQPLATSGAATTNVGGVNADYKWLSDRSLTIRLDGASSLEWPGVWALLFQDPSGDPSARTKSSIHIAGDLFPVWSDSKDVVLHQDSKVPVTFGVVDGRQAPVDAATLLGRADLSVVLTDAAGTVHPLFDAVPKDQIGAPRELDLHGVVPGNATLRLTLSVTTADAVDAQGAYFPGTVLAPQSVDLPVAVTPPVGYPTISNAVVDFGKLTEPGEVSAKLTVTGPGCVWLPDDAALDVAAAPDGVTDVRVSSADSAQDSCLQVAEGATSQLPLTISVQTVGNGVVNGKVPVSVSPTDQSAPSVQVDVPFTLAMQKPVNWGTFGATGILALLLGPGIPLLLLYLMKWLGAKVPGRALYTKEIPVHVQGSTVLRGADRFTLRNDDLTQLVAPPEGGVRSLQAGSAELRTHVGLSPFGRGYVVATAPGRAGAGQLSAMHGKTPDAKLPLNVHDKWFVLHDPSGSPEAASVVLLVGGDSDPEVRDRMVREINEQLPQVLADLRAQAARAEGGQAVPPPPPNPFDPQGSAGPGPGSTNPFSDSPFSGSPSGGGPSGGNPFGGPPGPLGANPFGSAPPPSPGPNPSGGNPFGRTGPPPGAPPDPRNPFG